jgi:hypothetical protein
MINFSQAQPLLDNVWVIPNFFQDFNQIKSSYRSGNQLWHSQYPNRLLTPWDSNKDIQQILSMLPYKIATLTREHFETQVGYASIDLSGNQIMMHRLHPDIGCFVQVCMSDTVNNEIGSVFCTNENVNKNHPTDYADISEFVQSDLLPVAYEPNTAWIMINRPRRFFGTLNPVPANTFRETLNFHLRRY